MAAVVTQTYTIPRNFQRGSTQFAQVNGLNPDSGELEALGLTLTGNATTFIGSLIEKELEYTDVGGEFAAMFPTQELMEAAVANLFQLVMELRFATGAVVQVTTVVVP